MGFISRFISIFQNSDAKQNIEEMELLLLETGLSPSIVTSLITTLQGKPFGMGNKENITQCIKTELSPLIQKYSFSPPSSELHVVLFVGVNGVGKTTTLAKFAHRCVHHYGLDTDDILFSAADTFRAAAIEQLQVHAERLGLEICMQQQGADPSAVIYDSVVLAQRSKKRLLCIDSAGRMHTRADLMQQLEKNHRVLLKHIQESQLSIFIVLDGNSGLNTVSQVQNFSQHLPLNAAILTKFDGSTRGGIIPSIAADSKLPFAFLGTGEKYNDLIEFSVEDFLNDFLTP